METRRTMIMVAALLFGVAAAVAIWTYLGGVQERANDDARLVKVFVVKQDVKRGVPAEQAIAAGLIGEDSIPQKFRPSTAITDLGAIRGKVALTNLASGQIVGEGLFVEPRAATVSFAQRIPAGQVAISVQVDAVHGVASLVVPGDKVNILVPTADGMRTLFQNVDVIAVGTTPVATLGETVPAPAAANTGLITFAVPPLAAERIALAASSAGAGLYLTLVHPDNQPVPVPPVTAGNLFPTSLSPYA